MSWTKQGDRDNTYVSNVAAPYVASVPACRIVRYCEESTWPFLIRYYVRKHQTMGSKQVVRRTAYGEELVNVSVKGLYISGNGKERIDGVVAVGARVQVPIIQFAPAYDKDDTRGRRTTCAQQYEGCLRWEWLGPRRCIHKR